MRLGVPTKVIAAVFALAAFAVAVVAGLAAGNPSGHVLGVAIGSMVICQLLGLVVGAAGEHVVNEHLQSQRVRPVTEGKRAPALSGAQTAGG